MQILRSETTKICFKRKDSQGNVISSLPDEMYFTVKKDYRDDKALISKSLSDGGISFDSESNEYTVLIRPQDTDKLPFGKYYCDIKRKIGNSERYLLPLTELEICPVVTHLINEQAGL